MENEQLIAEPLNDHSQLDGIFHEMIFKMPNPITPMDYDTPSTSTKNKIINETKNNSQLHQHQPGLRCPTCYGIFLSPDYLQTHYKKFHSTNELCSSYSQTEMPQDVLKTTNSKTVMSIMGKLNIERIIEQQNQNNLLRTTVTSLNGLLTTEREKHYDQMVEMTSKSANCSNGIIEKEFEKLQEQNTTLTLQLQRQRNTIENMQQLQITTNKSLEEAQIDLQKTKKQNEILNNSISTIKQEHDQEKQQNDILIHTQGWQIDQTNASYEKLQKQFTSNKERYEMNISILYEELTATRLQNHQLKTQLDTITMENQPTEAHSQLDGTNSSTH